MARVSRGFQGRCPEVGSGGDIELRDVGEAEFKGLDGRHRLFEVTWTPAATQTLTDDAPTTSQAE